MRVPSVPHWRRPTAPEDEGAIWLAWLVRLRWVAILAQVLTVALVVRLLDQTWSLFVLGGVEVVLVAANVHAMRIVRSDQHVSQPLLFAQLMLDVCALTTFFVLAGGFENPFTVLYLVHVAMAAVMLRPAWAAALTGVVLVVYGGLHLGHLPLHLERHVLGEQVLTVGGNIVAQAVSAVTIAAFMVGLANTLRWRERLLLEAQDRTARTDRLRSVGTMAAGAAHELNTPLSTIGLRLRRVARRHLDEATTHDLDAIRSQLKRCEEIVQQLLVSAGDPAASQMERGPLGVMVSEAVSLWSYGNGVEVTVSDTSENVLVELPRVAFVQGLVNLLENAREAQQEVGVDAPLEVDVTRADGVGEVIVRDHGVGLPKDTERVGDPFFTTKAAGTGLGVFVARAVADGSGGGLRYVGGDGWTEAHWWFPAAPFEAGQQDDERTT